MRARGKTPDLASDALGSCFSFLGFFSMIYPQFAPDAAETISFPLPGNTTQKY